MCTRQLQSSYLLNELLGEFVFLGFCSHQTLMLSQHNPGTTATLSCLITRHTTLVVGQSRPWRQCWFSCEIHLPEPRLARWLSLLPSAINHSALHPPHLHLWWSGATALSAALLLRNAASNRPNTHMRARTRTYSDVQSGIFEGLFTRMVWVSCWTRPFLSHDDKNTFVIFAIGLSPRTISMCSCCFLNNRILCISFKKKRIDETCLTDLDLEITKVNRFIQPRSMLKRLMRWELSHTCTVAHVHRW